MGEPSASPARKLHRDAHLVVRILTLRKRLGFLFVISSVCFSRPFIPKSVHLHLLMDHLEWLVLQPPAFEEILSSNSPFPRHGSLIGIFSAGEWMIFQASARYSETMVLCHMKNYSTNMWDLRLSIMITGCPQMCLLILVKLQSLWIRNSSRQSIFAVLYGMRLRSLDRSRGDQSMGDERNHTNISPNIWLLTGVFVIPTDHFPW